MSWFISDFSLSNKYEDDCSEGAALQEEEFDDENDKTRDLFNIPVSPGSQILQTTWMKWAGSWVGILRGKSGDWLTDWLTELHCSAALVSLASCRRSEVLPLPVVTGGHQRQPGPPQHLKLSRQIRNKNKFELLLYKHSTINRESEVSGLYLSWGQSNTLILISWSPLQKVGPHGEERRCKQCPVWDINHHESVIREGHHHQSCTAVP